MNSCFDRRTFVGHLLISAALGAVEVLPGGASGVAAAALRRDTGPRGPLLDVEGSALLDPAGRPLLAA